MQYVCDADQTTWFRIETDAEAISESQAMAHAVEKYFRQAREQATKSYVPPRSGHYIEQNIGLKAHIQRAMEEARKASAEANQRLADINQRLSRLDAEIGEMRAAADKEAAAEAERIKAAAEEDARKIVQAAELEIAAAAKSAGLLTHARAGRLPSLFLTQPIWGPWTSLRMEISFLAGKATLIMCFTASARATRRSGVKRRFLIR